MDTIYLSNQRRHNCSTLIFCRFFWFVVYHTFRGIDLDCLAVFCGWKLCLGQLWFCEQYADSGYCSYDIDVDRAQRRNGGTETEKSSYLFQKAQYHFFHLYGSDWAVGWLYFVRTDSPILGAFVYYLVCQLNISCRGVTSNRKSLQLMINP